jgi:hypothetical protein
MFSGKYGAENPNNYNVRGLASHTRAIECGGETLHGIGGWLLLFCIQNTILAALDGILLLFRSWVGIGDLLIACITAFAVFTGVSVWRVRPYALRVVETYLIFVFGWTGWQLLYHQTGEQYFTIIGVVLWWLYFKKSKRVKATFGRNL